MKRQTVTFPSEVDAKVEQYRAKKLKDEGKIPSFQAAVLELIQKGLSA